MKNFTGPRQRLVARVKAGWFPGPERPAGAALLRRQRWTQHSCPHRRRSSRPRSIGGSSGSSGGGPNHALHAVLTS